MPLEDKITIQIDIDKRAFERLQWLSLQIFNDEIFAGLVLERAIKDMYDSLVEEI